MDGQVLELENVMTWIPLYTLFAAIFRISSLRSGDRSKLAEVVQWIRGGADA